MPATEEPLERIKREWYTLWFLSSTAFHPFNARFKFILCEILSLASAWCPGESKEAPDGCWKCQASGNNVHPSPTSIPQGTMKVFVNSCCQKSSGQYTNTGANVEDATATNNLIGSVPATKDVLNRTEEWS